MAFIVTRHRCLYDLDEATTSHTQSPPGTVCPVAVPGASFQSADAIHALSDMDLSEQPNNGVAADQEVCPSQALSDN